MNAKERLQRHLQEVIERELDSMDPSDADLTSEQLSVLVELDWTVTC